MATIQINCSTKDASIYYTENGSNPSKNSSLYTSPITTSASIVKAIGIKEGYEDSEIASWENPYTNVAVGDQIILDGIESTVFYVTDNLRLAVDNHGLSYYVYGVEDNEVNDSPDYSFQWGAYETLVGASYNDIGMGLNNTELALSNSQSLIVTTNIPTGGSVTPTTLWKSLQDIRNQRINGNKWYIPNSAEGLILEDNKSIVPNSTNRYYWSSSEIDSENSKFYSFISRPSITNNKTQALLARLIRSF